MEDKIEVGEYVRLARNQGINKIIDKENDRYVLESEIADSYGDITFFLYECELKDEIVKHSKQLIDLIEVGDFVNGMEILHIDGNELYVEWSNEFEEFTGFLENKDIKTILTKESYMANCYKIRGKKEI